MNALFQSIPANEGIPKVGLGEGEKFDIAAAHLTWKVKGEDSGYGSLSEHLTGVKFSTTQKGVNHV